MSKAFTATVEIVCASLKNDQSSICQVEGQHVASYIREIYNALSAIEIEERKCNGPVSISTT